MDVVILIIFYDHYLTNNDIAFCMFTLPIYLKQSASQSRSRKQYLLGIRPLYLNTFKVENHIKFFKERKVSCVTSYNHVYYLSFFRSFSFPLLLSSLLLDLFLWRHTWHSLRWALESVMCDVIKIRLNLFFRGFLFHFSSQWTYFMTSHMTISAHLAK